MAVVHALFGWKQSNFSTYEETYYKYGGSINTHPDLVRFFLSQQKINFRFWHCMRDGKVVAAYFDTENKHLGLDVWRDYPISCDEIMIPVDPNAKILLPIRTNKISSHNRENIHNASFWLRKNRQVCYVREGFSVKTTKKRNGELKKFFAEGGESIALNQMSPREIAEIYVKLFKLRFGDGIRCYSKENIENLFNAVPESVFGNALFFKGNPCALDLVLCGRNDKFLYFDVPNGGVDPAVKGFSPGSLVMWKNILDARALCQSENRKMLFSIGLYKTYWNYKLLWSEALPTGKSFSL